MPFFYGTILHKLLDLLIGVIPNLNKTLIGSSKHNSASVDIYIPPDCPWSKRALKLLDSFLIKYNLYVINNNDDELKKLVMKFLFLLSHKYL